MPRDCDPTLVSIMDSGFFTPYFNVQLMDLNRSDVMFETSDVLGFEQDGLTLKVVFHDPTYFDDFYTFRLQRGIIVAGVPNLVTSCCYWPLHDRHEKRVRTLEGHVFPNEFYSVAGDMTYSQIIDDVCSQFSLSYVMEDPAADWLGYQFFPDGRTLQLNDAKYFFTLLRQKYMIFATDYDLDTLYFFQAKLTGPAYPAGYTLITAGQVQQAGHGALKNKRLLSRDEADTVHYSGDVDSPLHNLGFLESTADHPDKTWFIDTQNWVLQGIPPNLKYLDFDAIRTTQDIINLVMWPAKFREVFNPKLNPSWQWQARWLDIFGDTEGGALPSTIMAMAPYTPLNTSLFNGVLDETDNNLQAAMNTIDDHGHIFVGGSTDHGDLSGLLDDDHTQYHNNARGDVRYQPLDSDLTSISALGSGPGKMLYTTLIHTWAEADLTSAGRALLDDVDAAAQRATLGLTNVAYTDVANTFTATQYINVNSTSALKVEQAGVNNNVFIVDTTGAAGNGLVGIGAAPTTALFDIKCQTTVGMFSMFRYNDGPAYGSSASWRRARGTFALPTATQKDDVIGSITFRGYGATGFVNNNCAGVFAFAAENFTDTAAGGYFSFQTAPCGAKVPVERLRVDSTGYIGIGITVPTARLHVVGATDVQQFILKAHSTQTNNLFEMQDSTSAIHNRFNNPGAASAYENVLNETGSQYLDLRIETDSYNAIFVDASNESIVIMSNAAGKIGVFGVAAVVQQTALTAQLTTITCSAPGVADYAIQDLAAGGFGFVTADEGQSTLKVIANLQIRVAELEIRLKSYGWLP